MKKKLVKISEGCEIWQCCKQTLYNYAREANAFVKIGRFVRIDVDVMNSFFDSHRGNIGR